ncbi:MAG: hypothetical protein ACJ763_04345 [Bdellovibrionia bacterium]
MSRKLSSSIFAFTLLTSLLVSPAHAGPRSGGGGDARCLEYANLMGEIVKTLALAGQDKINAINPLVRLDDLIQVKRNLRCLPVVQLDRQARSNPATGQTDLLVNEWEKLDLNQKLGLTAHEMSVLAGYENDGEYYISEDLVKIARTNSQAINNRMSADQVMENNDGSVTFIRPFAMVNGKKFYFGTENKYAKALFLGIPVDTIHVENERSEPVAQGICKFLQYQNATSYSQSEVSGSDYASVDENGHLKGLKAKDSASLGGTVIVVTEVDYSKLSRFESITCK